MGPRLRAASVLVLVLGAGIALGVVVERHRTAPGAEAMSEEQRHEAALDELRRDLELDDEQIAEVHAILARRQRLVQEKWEQLRPEVEGAMQGVHTEIAALLRQEQRAKFHEWLLRRRGRAHETWSGIPADEK